MPIHYTVREKANYINREEPPKYYMTAVSFNCISRTRLINHMAHNTSMTKEEARTALNSIYDSLLHFLELGFNVSLGDLGYFSLSLRSHGSPTPKDVTADKLKEIKPQFNPGKKFYRDVNKIPVHKFPSTQG